MCRKLIYLVSFVLVLGLTVSVANADIESDLVAWWSFNDGSGTTALESVSGLHGTLVGGPSWTRKVGGALEFDGVDDYVTAGPDEALNFTGSFTIAAWIKIDQWTHKHEIVVYKATEDWANKCWRLNRAGDRDTIAITTIGTQKLRGSTAVNDGEWHHIAAVFDDDADMMYLYLDAVEDASTGFGGNPPGGTGPLLIGCERDDELSDPPPPLRRFWGGLIDEVHIYSRALSPEDIKELYESKPLAVPRGNASRPSPADGATDVPQEVALTWRPGAYVEGLSPKHRVFFSENFDDVNDGIGGIEQDVERYPIDANLGLDLGKTCYWRVDEANSTTGWDIGPVWQFTVADYLVVEDFEDYNDSSPNIIYEAWIDGWDNPANGSTVCNPEPDFLAGEHYVETKIIHGNKQAMPYTFDNSGPANYSEAERTFTAAQDWTREGVDSLSLWFRGYPAYVGSFVEAPAGTYTMTASGTDIWSTADEFHFAYKELSGAGAIIAKVESVQNTHEFAKAGVMIRDTLEADSANAALLITPENGVRFQFRNTTGGTTDRFFEEGITAPQWVKLERTVGGLVRAYYSADGNTWTQLNLTTVTMNTPMYIGLALTSHDTALTCEAKFSNVTSDGTGQWVNQDIGMLSNEAEPMYVSVQDGSGTSATVYHDDPDASLINTWTEWNIDLQEFSDAGVVLTDVSSLSIGFGDADNPQPGGSGLVFFDDIRLYLDSLLPSVITISPVDTFEATGDNGTIVSTNGVAVADLILGTTTFAGDPMHANFPPEDADNFDLSVGASADDQAYVQTVFAMPVTTIFIIEKGGNDTGYMQSLDENGDPLDEPTPFLPADFKDTGLTGVQGQKVAAAVIALEVPVYGIRILPPDDKVLGFDPTSVSGVPAQ